MKKLFAIFSYSICLTFYYQLWNYHQFCIPWIHKNRYIEIKFQIPFQVCFPYWFFSKIICLFIPKIICLFIPKLQYSLHFFIIFTWYTLYTFNMCFFVTTCTDITFIFDDKLYIFYNWYLTLPQKFLLVTF